MLRKTLLSPAAKLFYASLVVATLAACGGSSNGSTTTTTSSSSTPAATLTKITVSPTNPTIAQTATQSFTAIGTYSDNSTKNLNGSVTWSSSDPTVATIGSGSGVAQPLKAGTTNITATSGTITSTPSTLTVLPSTVTLTSLVVTPNNPTLARIGLTQQFKAVGTFSDNSQSDQTNSVTWNTGTPSVASINAQGLAQSLAAGTTQITATSGSITSNSTTLTVNGPVLQGISITPPNPTTAKGFSTQFTATATYTGLPPQDVTNTTSWTSSSPAIATISDNTPTKGLANGVAAGSVTITAVFQGKTATTGLTVNTDVLKKITVISSVTPDTTVLPRGLSRPYMARGDFTATAAASDTTVTSTQDVTNDVTWSAPDNASSPASKPETGSVATVGNTAGNLGCPAAKGCAYARTKTGQSDITATLAGTTTTTTTTTPATIPGVTQPTTTTTTTTTPTVTGKSTLLVTDPVITQVIVNVNNSAIAAGSKTQYTATGVYSDNGKNDNANNNDLTSVVTWDSTNKAVATISNAAGTNGLATATSSPGSTVIRATLPANTATPNAPVNGQAIVTDTPLTVTAATLSKIDLTLPTSIAKGTSVQVIAKGTYSDASIQDITGSVTWNSSLTGTATISSSGVAKGIAAGNTVISATDSTTGITSTLGTPNLTVTNATLSSLALTPTAAASIAAGTTKQYTATGTFSDMSTQDLTANNATWSSSRSNVASVDVKGLASGLTAGDTAISAAFLGISSSSAPVLTVKSSAITLSSIAITPSGATVAAGTSKQLTATGTYSDGTTQDITASVTWTSSDTGVASITAAGLAKGLVAGKPDEAGKPTNGTSTITATFGSGASQVQGTAPFNVSPATLVSIAVTSAGSATTVAVGSTLQFTATGTYSDGTTQGLTLDPALHWVSSNVSVATIVDTAAPGAGVATGKATGSTVISAVFGTTPNTVTGTKTLTVP